MTDYERDQLKLRLRRIWENTHLEARRDTSQVVRVRIEVEDYAPLPYEPTEKSEECGSRFAE